MTRHHTIGWRALSFAALMVTFALTIALTGCGEDYKRSKARRLEQKGEWREAAELYLEIGDRAEAAAVFESLTDFNRAAQLHEEQENWDKAAECYEKANNRGKAAELFEKLGQLERAGDLLAEAGDTPAARGLYIRADAWAKAGQMLELEGKFTEAASAYEKGEDFSGFGRMLEKAEKPIEAAAAYEKGENYRAAAALYEAAQMWDAAARNASALAERDSGADAKLQAARMLIKSGDTDGAAKYFDAALTQAEEFGNFAAVVEISVESGKVREGMDWMIDEAEKLLDEGRAAVAAEALLALNDIPDEHWRKVKSAQKRRFDKLVDRMLEAVELLPEITTIEGTNHFIVYENTGVKTFEYCQIQGAVRNNGPEPFARVEVEITLFKKDFESFVEGQDAWGAIPEELTTKFENEEAGYRETIEILNLQPGEIRQFTRKLGNGIPYENFSDFVTTAEK